MMPIGDYRREMDTSYQLDDATAEALLTGRAVAGELDPLRQVIEAYRDAARRPVPPRGELAARMATGVFVDPTGPDLTAARPTGRHRPPAAATTRRRRTRMAVTAGLATTAAKLAGLSIAAKASAGIAIALVGVGTAGAAGALPDPVQDRFDTVVHSVTGEDVPTPADVDRDTDSSEFGGRVSDDARDGGVDGDEISDEARRQGEQRRPDQVPAPVPTDPGRPADPGQPSDPGQPGDPGPPSDPGPPAERPGPPPPPPER